MTVDVAQTTLDCIRGDDNLYDIDLTVAIASPGTDKAWFTAKRHYSDVDADAVIQKGLNVSPLSGIIVTNASEGQCQVQLVPTDTASLEDTALHYDVQVKLASDAKVRTVARGILLLSGEVTKATS